MFDVRLSADEIRLLLAALHTYQWHGSSSVGAAGEPVKPDFLPQVCEKLGQAIGAIA